jgi:uncharacterized protein involved in type VI secretion and phage assembly
MSEHQGLLHLFGAPHRQGGRIYGVVIGLVTNNEDPDKLGRVKVKFPWLSDADESGWARVAAPMAGKQMGLYFLPEVHDEVLVAFEHGRVDRPIVLGALWNGKDTPPADNADGKNNLRVLKSRSGHTVTLDDTEGSEKITIADGKQKNRIVLSAADNSLEITSEGDLTVKAKGKITLQSDGEVSVKGSSVSLNDGKLKVK